MLSIREALDAIVRRAQPLAPERVSLPEARGRVLAAPLRAREDLPPFDHSAMDGWAVRADDVASASEASPSKLRIVGEARAGGEAGPRVGPGEAVRIFTGAPVPEGADCVVMQEDTTREGGHIVVRLAGAPSKHVRRRAEIAAAGAVILASGTSIGAGEIGLAASQSYGELVVHRRPRVAIVGSGDELRDLGDPPRPGSILDSNGPALVAAVEEAGAQASLLLRGIDDAGELAGRMRDALGWCDVLVTTGGVSVGDYDLVHQALAELDVEEVFWKARIKPGKPIRFGVRGPRLVFGLPGNPVSALVTFEVFVRPALRVLLGDPRPHRATLDARLSRAMRAADTRTELARARIDEIDGELVATPLREKGSGDLTSMASADALVILPEGAGTIERARALDLRSTRGRVEAPF